MDDGIAVPDTPAMASALAMLALILPANQAFTIPSPLIQAALSPCRAPTFPVMAVPVASPKKPLAKKPVVKKNPVVKKPVPKKVVKKPVVKKPVVKKVVKMPIVKKVAAKSAVRNPRFAIEAKQKAKRIASHKAAKLREQQNDKKAQARKEKSKAYCDSQFSGKIGRKGAFNFRTLLLGFSENQAKDIEKRTTRSNKYF